MAAKGKGAGKVVKISDYFNKSRPVEYNSIDGDTIYDLNDDWTLVDGEVDIKKLTAKELDKKEDE
ncbi:MAG: hypothetical protein HRU19_28955 [Pseudobacteriovorax sp.]|nr:hypothetical protein [Pseudobacteriovorax sp.]